ncbi:methylated-DNA--[protein]-cysteine S-methyltransferase [Sutcliffiella horikoshii]|uniref:methylated-DNA--[protein]-cysteine S-methyltransferase n=1 Tax=Sutcliffiella horikoshii TaxID=79883 RepID=UPI003850A1C7
MYQYSSTPTPIGTIYVICDANHLVRIEFDKEFLQKDKDADLYKYAPDDPLCELVITQLQEYFAGSRSEFEVPFHLEGTVFQKEVWKALSNIQYGEVKCYQDIAKEINRPLAVRAIGQANRRNPLPIVIPCHRVIGKNKDLVGYAGDKIGMKEELLKLEGVLV